MALFIFRKFILQTCMRSHLVGLDVWFLVGAFAYFHTSCVRTVKALARLHRCAGSPEPSLVAYVISTIITWAGSNIVRKKNFFLRIYHRQILNTFKTSGHVLNCWCIDSQMSSIKVYMWRTLWTPQPPHSQPWFTSCGKHWSMHYFLIKILSHINMV